MIDFEQIRRSVSMTEVLEREGVAVRRGWAVCPFHADTHPSMRVYPDGFYCFVCGAGGDVIRFYARLHGLKNGEAARALAGGAQAQAPSYRRSMELEQSRRRKQRADAWTREVLEDLLAYRRGRYRAGENTEETDRLLDRLERGDWTDDSGGAAGPGDLPCPF